MLDWPPQSRCGWRTVAALFAGGWLSLADRSAGRETRRPRTGREPTGALSARAVAIGALLIPLNALWLAHIEYVRYTDNATTSALFFNCITALLLLLTISAAARRLWPALALSRAELLTIYIMLVIASALAGHDQLQILFTTITWVFRHATPENKWAELIIPHLPQHLVMGKPGPLVHLHMGGSTLYTPEHLQAWLGPVAWWSLFALIVVWTMLALMCLLRRQWDYERLNYPIAEAALDAAFPERGLFVSRLFWIAFALAALGQFWRLAHNLWPIVPPLNIGVHYYRFRGMPLAAAGSIPLSSYPFSYGLAYLMPLQLAFSVWVFFWLARVEMVVAAIFGRYRWRGFPYIQQQGVGAYFGVAGFVLWAARHHLAKAWAAALGRRVVDDSGEPLPLGAAVWAFLLGFGALVTFSAAAGMRPLTAAIFFALFFGIVLTITRIRAELGLPTIELYQVGADDVMQTIAGTKAWSRKDLVVMTLYFWLVRTHRQLPMPVHADVLHIAHRAGLRLRVVPPLVMGTSALAVLAAFWALLHVTYQVGYESARFTGPAGWAFGSDPWRKLASWLANPRKPQLGASMGYAFGVAFTAFLAAMRTRFVWWPFHPVGYVVAGSFGLFRLWLPIFVTWLVKTVLLRYGGLRAYQSARPFFIGLIFGEFTAAFIRTLLDLAFSLYLPATSGIGGL